MNWEAAADRGLEAVAIVAEHRIAGAMADGAFDRLPKRGQIDCSLSGERFFAAWFAARLLREADHDDTKGGRGPVGPEACAR